MKTVHCYRAFVAVTLLLTSAVAAGGDAASTELLCPHNGPGRCDHQPTAAAQPNGFNVEYVGSYSTPDYAGAVYVQDSLVYVAIHYSGFLIINVADPANPSLACSFSTPNNAKDLFVRDSL
ncbi:MAG: hypothetical protein JSU65_06500, partial [Candidatus Zixiibacteriota bacterium]